jgi:pyocin large subunit-like protein
MSYEAVVAAAVRRELGGSHQAIKTLMRRTGASSRTAKNWLAGATGPTGAHLVKLMRSSDSVFEAVLRMAGREQALTSPRLAEARELVRRAETLLGEGH